MTTMIYYDYYDLLWFTMIYYDLLWFTMIYYDLP